MINISLDEKDREKILGEIQSCQDKVTQTMVPTLIAIGLISIADRENLEIITMYAAFSVLFSASLYTATLSYKIFRNATFLNVILDNQETDNLIHWEDALARFSKTDAQPRILGYETQTVAVIYVIFSITFILMFFTISPILSGVLGAILLLVPLQIFLIPSHGTKYYKNWENIIVGKTMPPFKKQ